MKGLIFTYLLTYGGAAASLVNPFVGLMVYFCFAIIRPEGLWYWSVPVGNYSRIVAIALLIGWAVKGFGDWNFRGAKPIVYTLLGFYAWAGVCALFAANQDLAWNYMESLGKIILPFVVGITLIDSVRKLKITAWVLVLSMGFVAYEFNLSYYQGYNRVAEVGLGPMDNNCISIAMVAAVGLAFFLGLHESVWWRRWLAFGSAGLMAHVPMFGMSRGGMLGLIVTGAVALFLIPKRPKHYAAFAIAVAIGWTLAGPSVRERFMTTFTEPEERGTSAANRLDFWGFCWTFMKENPIVGIGPDQYPQTAKARFGRGGEAHSLWFQTGAELGFPGLGLLLGFYGLTVITMWKLLRRQTTRDAWQSQFAGMTIAALAGFGVSVSFVSIEGLELPYYIVLLAAGAVKLADPAFAHEGLDTVCSDEPLVEPRYSLST